MLNTRFHFERNILKASNLDKEDRRKARRMERGGPKGGLDALVRPEECVQAAVVKYALLRRR